MRVLAHGRLYLRWQARTPVAQALEKAAAVNSSRRRCCVVVGYS